MRTRSRATPPPSTRSSARLQAQTDSDAPSAIASSSTSAPQDTQPQSKRQKTEKGDVQRHSISKIRGRGKLRLMTEMPMDILFEIFSCLEPQDVLRLSQASKSLRKILLNRSAISIWKSAFLNIDVNVPPAIPSDLNHPQYANLLYGRHCHQCAASSANFVHWAARIRLCPSCLKGKAIVQSLTNIKPGTLSLCLRWDGLRRDYRPWYLKKDIQEVSKELTKLNDNPVLLRQFIRESEKLKNIKLAHGSLCEEWEFRRQKQRLLEIQNIRRSRKEALIELIKAEGFSNELEILGPDGLGMVPGMNDARPLTDRIWSNIKPEVIAFFEEYRHVRFKQKQQDVQWGRIGLLSPVFSKYLLSQPRGEPRPTYADISGQEPFKSLIFVTPLDVVLTTADFEACADQIPQACDDWLQSNTKKLLQLLPKHAASKSSILELATTFFRCHWCREPISYPRILVHDCLRRDHPGLEDYDDDELYYANRSTKPWNFGGAQVTHDKDASNYAKDIITACGKKSASVSAATMDELDQRVECLRCISPRGRLVMRWKTAIIHEIEEHYEQPCAGPRWKIIGEEDFPAVKEKEEKVMSKKDMYIHLAHMHKIPRDRFKANTFIPLDNPLHEPPYAVRIPVRA